MQRAQERTRVDATGTDPRPAAWAPPQAPGAQRTFNRGWHMLVLAAALATTVSAAVRDGAGQPVMAISAVDLSARLDRTAARSLGAAIAGVAADVGRALGARPAGAAILPAA